MSHSAASLAQFVNTQDALSRLDERAGRHPDRDGWGAQRLLIDACDANWVSGDLLDPHELALQEADSATSLSSPIMMSARNRLRLHSQILQGVGGKNISAEEIFRIFSRGRQAPDNDLALYDPDEDRAQPVSEWCSAWTESDGEISLRRVAAGLMHWIALNVFANARLIDALLLAERMAVSARLTRHIPLALGIGARATKWRPSPYRPDEDFEERFLQAAEASARSGMLELDAHDLWRERAGRHLKHRRSTSHAGDILDLVAQNGVVSARSIEETIGLTVQTAARHCNALAEAGVLREITGQKHFRIWGRG